MPAQRQEDQASDRLAEMENGLSEAGATLRRTEAALGESREARVRTEAQVEQAKSDRDVIAERITERLDSKPETILADSEIDPEEELPPRDVVEVKLERLIRERDNMGPVNLRAEQELHELEEQIGSMQTEREDLLAAIARLRQGISALNREGRERLLAAFEQVNQHFEELCTFIRWRTSAFGAYGRRRSVGSRPGDHGEPARRNCRLCRCCRAASRP